MDTISRRRCRVLLYLALCVVLLLSSCGSAPAGETTPGASQATTESTGTATPTTTATTPEETPPPETTNPEDDWPYALLPSWLPPAPREEIYYVGEENGIITIQMFGYEENYYEYNNTLKTKAGFRTTGGYIKGREMSLYGGMPYVKIEGDTHWVIYFSSVDINHINNPYNPLNPLTYLSPTGYVYEMKITDTYRVDENLLRHWPPPHTDLGLEERTFDSWPAPYLPDGFPEAVDTVEAVVKQTRGGIHLRLYFELDAFYAYRTALWEAGFVEYRSQYMPQSDTDVYANENGDYYYILSSPLKSDKPDKMLYDLLVVRYEDAAGWMESK